MGTPKRAHHKSDLLVAAPSIYYDGFSTWLEDYGGGWGCSVHIPFSILLWRQNQYAKAGRKEGKQKGYAIPKQNITTQTAQK